MWDEVAFGPQNLGYSPEQVRTRVEEALAQLELKHLSHLNPRDLDYSGRKQVALASALAMQTPVVVLDEPTAGLDAIELARLGQVITSLHRQGRTILIISRDMDFLAENVARLVLMRHGQAVVDAPSQQFFQNANRTNVPAGSGRRRRTWLLSSRWARRCFAAETS